MPDPVSRLEMARQEVDRLFGDGSGVVKDATRLSPSPHPSARRVTLDARQRAATCTEPRAVGMRRPLPAPPQPIGYTTTALAPPSKGRLMRCTG